MWLRKGDGTGVPVLMPSYMQDGIARCLSEGWVEVPDPTTEPAPAVVPVPAPPELLAKVEQDRITAVHKHNSAARSAFADMGMGPKPRSAKGRQ